ncbi:MAG: hypothetical protein ABIT05_03955 [Chitinophagaceae bacterium]
MKRAFLFVLTITASAAFAQNEFAATAFYTEFKKICADGQTGFTAYKGDKRGSDFEELALEYKVKTLLPLADSGKIVVPVSGPPFMVCYFEPDKIRLKVDQRGSNLRDAILIAFEKPLYARTETTVVNNYPLTISYYFTDPHETRSSGAAFKMVIYYSLGKYYLSLEIRGISQ